MFYVLWAMSFVACLIFESGLELKMNKDLADQGYKIDRIKYREFLSHINSDKKIMAITGLLIPFINVMLEFYKMMQYEQSRPFLVNQLRVMKCIELFTKDEEVKYNNNPTGKNAISISLKSEIEKKNNETKTKKENSENISKDLFEKKKLKFLLDTLIDLKEEYTEEYLKKISPEEFVSLLKNSLRSRSEKQYELDYIKNHSDEHLQSKPSFELSTEEINIRLQQLNTILISINDKDINTKGKTLEKK